MKTQLHPGARWLFRLKGYSGAIFLAFFLTWAAISFIGIFKTMTSESGGFMGLLILISVFVFLFFVIIIAEIYARMTYNRWFYEFTEHQLRLERGIIWKQYSNIPYERVQNVDITRGIIARMCGFSTVNIQTAGFSYTPGKAAHSEGYIPAVPMEEAEKIREFLMKKISRNTKQGL